MRAQARRRRLANGWRTSPYFLELPKAKPLGVDAEIDRYSDKYRRKPQARGGLCAPGSQEGKPSPSVLLAPDFLLFRDLPPDGARAPCVGHDAHPQVLPAGALHQARARHSEHGQPPCQPGACARSRHTFPTFPVQGQEQGRARAAGRGGFVGGGGREGRGRPHAPGASHGALAQTDKLPTRTSANVHHFPLAIDRRAPPCTTLRPHRTRRRRLPKACVYPVICQAAHRGCSVPHVVTN